jgi:hypothetical protein
MSKIKSSSGDNTHPYLKGFDFWNKRPVWREPKRRFSPATIQYYEDWLQSLRQNERRLTNLGKAA